MPIRSDPAGWTDPRHVVGLDGETAARRYLESNGWELLAHRFKMGRLEVDLVVRKAALVAFVEVKTRRGLRFGSPLEAITWHKRREIARVAQAWIDRHGRPDETYRFDVVGIVSTGLGRSIHHVEDAFRLVR